MPSSWWHSVSTDVIVACWSLWGIVWFIGALYNARHAPAVRRRANRSYGWLVAVVIVWLLARALPSGDWQSLRVHSLPLRVIGAVLLLAGTTFTLWARAVLGTMWSSTVVAKQAHELRTDGPYAITRHPIYSGMLAMLAGSALLGGLGRWAPALVVGIVVVVVKAHLEERLMGETFPAEYERYRRQVPQLIPGLGWLRGRRR